MSASASAEAIASPEGTLDVALSLARIGWPVFPVRIAPLDDEGRTDKKPRVKWVEGATTDEATIAKWWRKWPESWVGVHAGRAGLLVVDVDTPKGSDDRDGRRELKRAGLTLPRTFAYVTRSGGQHHVYAAPTGPGAPPLTITKNAPVPGVDLRGGNGLTVYYGPALDAMPTLALAPEWAVAAATATREQATRTSGDVDAWLARCSPGKPDAEVRAILADVTEEGVDHDAMLALVTRFVRAGIAGRPGVADAIAKARATYVKHWPEHGRQWDTALSGSIGALGMPPATFALSKRERREGKKRSEKRTKTDVATDRDLELALVEHPDAGHRALDDGPIAEEVASRLKGWAFSETLGLIRYRGHVWQQADEAVLFEHVRLELRAIAKVEVAFAVERGDRTHAMNVAKLAARGKVVAVGRTLVGILANAAVKTDDHADLLNAPNGVVDLRTGELRPHDPALYFTKATGVPYTPGATSADWRQALTALPPKVAAWVQARLGQAMTGHTPDDAVMPLFEGTGSNGKSTILDGVRSAAGDYAVTVSDRLLLANPGDHPTELTQLMGARLAVAEELPEGRSLNVKRLKDVLGTATLSARQVRRDNVEWRASHSLVVSTNYRPIVAETDHGTWRRLALVDFPFTFVGPVLDDDGEEVYRLKSARERPGDAGLVRRLQRGDEAVLAWLVEGARRWYARGMVMPPAPKRVVRDTADWREDADPVFAYVRDKLETCEGYAIAASDLAHDFGDFLERRQAKPWAEQTIAQRFAGHALLPGVERAVVRFGAEVIPSRPPLAMKPLPISTKAWVGVRFRLPEATLPPPSREVVDDEARRGLL